MTPAEFGNLLTELERTGTPKSPLDSQILQSLIRLYLERRHLGHLLESIPKPAD